MLVFDFSSCDGYSENQYDDLSQGNNGGAWRGSWQRMAEDDYCRDIDNTTKVVVFAPGQAWCLPKDYNKEKAPFTCKSIMLFFVRNTKYLFVFRKIRLTP